MTIGAIPSDDPRANPMAGNPLVTKDDVRRAVVDLVEPVVPHLSPGGARARLGSFGTVFAPRPTRTTASMFAVVAGSDYLQYLQSWLSANA